MRSPILLILILCGAFLLRVIGLSDFPVGFTPDEASWGYDAYSLLKTGKDQWGESWPLTFRSFGDFKLPLYTYLTIPSVAIFGLNEFATRLPNALVGTFAVLATYLMVTELFRRRLSSSPITNHQSLAIVAALLLAISPWHMPLSRGAFEANLTTCLLPLGVWTFLKGIDKPRWMVVSALALGINMFSYHSARLITPLIVGLLILNKTTLLPRSGKLRLHRGVVKYKSAIGVFGVFLILAAYTMFFGAGARGTDIAIFNPTDNWAAVADRRYEAVLSGLPDLAARIFSNKVIYTFKTFSTNYLSYLSPQFLFTQGAGEWTYGMIPGRGVLYIVELLFILAALGAFTKKRDKSILFIVLWILLAPIPAALTKGPGYAGNRISVMMPAIQIFSAYGALVLWNYIKVRFPKLRKYLLPVYLSTLLLGFAFFLEDYVYHAPKHAAENMLYGRRETIKHARSVEDQYSTILINRSLSEPQIYVGFYTRWDPANYQNASRDWLRYEKEGRSFVDQLGEYHLGKYVFGNTHDTKNVGKPVLLVGGIRDIPQSAKLIKEVKTIDGKTVIFIANEED